MFYLFQGSNDDNESKRLRSVLGKYEEMSTVIMSGKTAELMGVERQPSTPLPGKKGRNSFPDLQKPNRPNTAARSIQHGFGDKKGASVEESSSSHSKPNKNLMRPPSSAERTKVKSSHGESRSSSSESSHRSDHKSDSRSDSAARGHKPSKPSVQTVPKTTDHHIDHRHTAKNATHSREPVLQELGKELSKSTSKQGSSKPSGRPGDQVENREAKDPISVLTVKEENRNDPVLNGRNRHRPRIQLPEVGTQGI